MLRQKLNCSPWSIRAPLHVYEAMNLAGGGDMERPAVSDGRAGHGQAGSAIEGGAVGGTGTVARGRCPGRTAAVDYAAWRT